MSTLGARRAARARHPSVRAVVAAPAVTDRLVERLRAAGACWPEVAGALLEARGRSGLDAAGFAARLGVERATLERAEAGAIAPASLPAPLRRLVAGVAPPR